MTSLTRSFRFRMSPPPSPSTATVAVVGLGYVGLPTALALHAAGVSVMGIDISETRLRDIVMGAVDLLPQDQEALRHARTSPRFTLLADAGRIGEADVVIVCVPTPVDAALQPDLRALTAACQTVVAQARRGQLVVLTSTSFVGTTRELVCAPLAERGFTIGSDVFVAFSPERIDPGNAQHHQATTPRVVGGATPACARRAATALSGVTPSTHVVSSLEAAEMTKLLENTFRAVNIAFANEMATAARHHQLDPVEIVEAAATKPFGFMPFYPSAGVGGHCIPCDPHYLLKPLQAAGGDAPLTDIAMQLIAGRPGVVAERALALLTQDGIDVRDASVLVVGAAYKPGVADVRESPALEILQALRDAGAQIAYHDPLVPTLELRQEPLVSVRHPDGRHYDLVVIVTVHDQATVAQLHDAPRVLDATYRTPVGVRRALV